jgi:hypothetical protein
MKLNIELKDGEFHFDYGLGKDYHGHCSMPMSIDSLKTFVNMCDYAMHQRDNSNEKFIREIGLKALIETDLERVEGWIKKHKKK